VEILDVKNCVIDNHAMLVNSFPTDSDEFFTPPFFSGGLFFTMYNIQIFDKNQNLLIQATFIDMDAVSAFLKEHYDSRNQRLYITKYGGL